MIIRLYEEKNVRTRLTIELYERESTFSVEMQKGLLYHYDKDLVLIRIDVRDPTLINNLMKELEEVLNDSEIKIIRKVA